MTFFEQCITIALCILASILTRALPFLFLTGNKPAPPLVRYLGNVLPAAVFGMLVVYCLKDTSFLRADHGLRYCRHRDSPHPPAANADLHGGRNNRLYAPGSADIPPLISYDSYVKRTPAQTVQASFFQRIVV